MTCFSSNDKGYPTIISGIMIDKIRYKARLVYRFGITDTLPDGTTWKVLTKTSNLSEITDVQAVALHGIWFLNRGEIMYATVQKDEKTGKVTVSSLRRIKSQLDYVGDSIRKTVADDLGNIWAMTREGWVYVLEGISPDAIRWYPVIKPGIRKLNDIYPTPKGIFLLLGKDHMHGKDRRGKRTLFIFICNRV